MIGYDLYGRSCIISETRTNLKSPNLNYTKANSRKRPYSLWTHLMLNFDHYCALRADGLLVLCTPPPTMRYVYHVKSDSCDCAYSLSTGYGHHFEANCVLMVDCFLVCFALCTIITSNVWTKNCYNRVFSLSTAFIHHLDANTSLQVNGFHVLRTLRPHCVYCMDTNSCDRGCL